MIVRSSSLTVAGWRYTEERETVSSRHCCATGRGSHVRPARDVPLGSFAELACQKIVFDLQLADLPVQNIDLSLAGRSLGQAAALKNTRGAIQQPLLPIGDLVRMDPELARQFGD